MCVYAKSLQLCKTLCDPMDGSLPDFFDNEILQPRILEWVALLQGIFLNQRLNLHLLHSCIGKWVLYH